jgi:hypothetical protein
MKTVVTAEESARRTVQVFDELLDGRDDVGNSAHIGLKTAALFTMRRLVGQFA